MLLRWWSCPLLGLLVGKTGRHLPIGDLAFDDERDAPVEWPGMAGPERVVAAGGVVVSIGGGPGMLGAR